jgi:hypothetical protein
MKNFFTLTLCFLTLSLTAQEPIIKSAWVESPVVDEFGDIIEGESIITSSSQGKFSNSATSDSDLTVNMQIGRGYYARQSNCTAIQ